MRALTPAGRMLIINQFGICLGFYMVLPFLAGYLRDDLGLATALVGTIIGVRTLSQQGLYLVGGTVADHIGPRVIIIAGCGLRVVAFGLFAVTTSLPGIVTATVLIGVAGALFSPAVATYLTHEAAERRAEAFALSNVVGNAGTLLGPVVGALLLGVDFRLVSAVAAVIFAIMTVIQLTMLPPRAPQAGKTGVLRSWGEVVTNRRFGAFTLAGSAYFALYNQLYLALPLEAERVTGHPAAVSAVFVVSTVAGIVLGVPLVAACRRRWSAGRSAATGLLLMGGGFLPVALTAPWPAGGSTVVAGLPVLVSTLVFSVGVAITHPFLIALIPVVGSERLVGTYYGYFYLISALAAFGISAGVGALLDLGHAGLRWAPFTLLLLAGLAGGGTIALMQHRGRLDARPSPDRAPASA